MAHAYAAITGSVSWRGQTYRLTKDDVWTADDPLVKGRPDLFRATPEVVRSSTATGTRADRPVERATRAPGEKRTGKLR